MTNEPTGDKHNVDDGVVNNTEKHRYEIRTDGELAGFAVYGRKGPGPGAENGIVRMVHTEIDDRFEGRGLGSKLARGALDDVRAQGMKVLADCPFIARWIDRHPDYQDLLVG